MREDSQSPQLTVPKEQIAQLATLYDQFVNAIDPFDCAQASAERSFLNKLQELHCNYAMQIDYQIFKREAVRQCRLYLKNNPPSSDEMNLAL
jgi:hypothetical protein